MHRAGKESYSSHEESSEELVEKSKNESEKDK